MNNFKAKSNHTVFLLLLLSLLFSVAACSHITDPDEDINSQVETQESSPTAIQPEKNSLILPSYAFEKEEIATQLAITKFWDMLQSFCGKSFNGQSTYPDNPEDSFYGKTLLAEFNNCQENEIRIPFSVEDDRTRTWIFTRTDKGVRLKHRHTHKDGSLDVITNYGGDAAAGEYFETDTPHPIKQAHLVFPADQFTKDLLPEAATNQWAIVLIEGNKNGETHGAIGYNLYRHSKKRFIATLNEIHD